MRRRLDLAASLVGEPRVLYLDEPTTGLDPRSRSEVWGMIRELTGTGATVLLTTQYLDEADQLAHDIAVIDHGKVIATGTPDELKATAGARVLEVVPADRARLAEVSAVLARWAGADAAADAEAGRVSVPVTGAALMPAVMRDLEGAGVELAEFSLRKSSLDEVFLALTGSRPEPEPAGEPRARELEGSPR
jgi:oleandomycin transport system ATP-binding protein